MSGPVLVTGGNGFVGSHAVEALLAQGYKVRCLLRPNSLLTWIETLPVDIQRADYFEPNGLRKAIEGCEAILHFGGATKAPDEAGYLRANAETTLNLLEAAAAACPGLKLFLYCSSQAALGPSPTLDPLSEEAPPRPISVYGRSKLGGEEACREFVGRFPLAIIRPPAVYGPRDKDILIFFKTVKWGLSPSVGRGPKYLSIVNALDVAGIAVKILESKLEGLEIFHVTDGETHTWDSISEAIALALDRHPLKVTVPVGLAALVGKFAAGFASIAGRTATLNRDKIDEMLQSYWLISSNKARNVLGYESQYPLHKGLRLTAEWYRLHGWL